MWPWPRESRGREDGGRSGKPEGEHDTRENVGTHVRINGPLLPSMGSKTRASLGGLYNPQDRLH